MATLSDAVKREIVQRLAYVESPKTIIKSVKEIYGIEVTNRQVSFYDPGNSNCQMSDNLRELFHQFREQYLHDRSSVLSTKRLFRIRRLEGMALRAEERGAFKLAAELYEQIAKEEGGMFKNKNLPQAASPPAALRIEEETDEERRAREAAAAASYDKQRRGDVSEDDAA